jgi:hypothetical protein
MKANIVQLRISGAIVRRCAEIARLEALRAEVLILKTEARRRTKTMPVEEYERRAKMASDEAWLLMSEPFNPKWVEVL